MADIEVSIGSVAEIPKGLDKVRSAVADAVGTGVDIGIRSASEKVLGALRDFNNLPQRKSASKDLSDRKETIDTMVGALSAVKVTRENVEEFRKSIEMLRLMASDTRRSGLARGNLDLVLLADETRLKANALGRGATAALTQARREETQADREEKAEIKRTLKQADFNDFDKDYAAAMAELQTAQSPQAIQEALVNLKSASKYRLRAASGVLNLRDKKALEESSNQDIKEGEQKLTDALNDNTSVINQWLKEYRASVAAGGVGIAAGNYVSNLMKSYYANRKDPYTELGGKIDDLIQWGSAGAGAVAGAAVGGPIGAILGGATGAVLGGWWNRTRAAAISTQEDAIEQLRWAIKFGGQGVGWQYAQLAEKTGFVKAEEIESLKTASETFGPSVAFGQVSADQWFALAHLPNTFAALNSGADEATLLEAMRADASMYSPGYAMKFFQMAGFSDNLRVLATSGMLESLNKDIPNAKKMAAYLLQATPALIPSYYDRGYEDRVQRMETLKKTIQDAGKEYYNSVGPVPFRMLGGSRSEEDVRNFLNLSQEDWQDRERSSLTPTTININIDGENALKLQGVYTDETALDKNIQYAVGGDL